MAQEVTIDLARERRRIRGTDETLMSIIKAHREDRPIIHRCAFGFMVALDGSKTPARLYVPTSRVEIRGPAEAEFVREAIAAWTEALARYDETTD